MALQGNSQNYLLLNRYIVKEYILNFIVCFIFFFLIFFINQILVLVNKVILKNINFEIIFSLVLSSIPQFLVFVIPFTTLSASSMVLGNLSANNELIAFKSAGISSFRIFKVLIILSIIFGLFNLYVTDTLVPRASDNHMALLNKVMVEFPTFEIESNSVNTIGGIIMKNGVVTNDEIHDIIIFDENNKTISAKSGTIRLIDLTNYIYELTLNDVNIMLLQDENIAFSKSENAILYLNFSSQVPTLTNTAPENLTISELKNQVEHHTSARNRNKKNSIENKDLAKIKLLDNLYSINKLEDLENSNIEYLFYELDNLIENEYINFYYQYYNAELFKKYALSFAPIALTLITLPFGYIKLKHGRLLGFGVSLFIAVLYWFTLFFSQLQIFKYDIHAGFFISLANVLMMLIGGITILFKRKNG